MQNQDILDILDEVKKEFSILNDFVEKSKQDASIVTLSAIKIKTISEHIRSCLDYMAVDIINKTGITKPNKIYFPYGNSVQFIHRVSKWMKDLEVKNKSIHDIIIGNQDFNLPQDERWLIQLCNLNIKVKHNELERTTRQHSGRSLQLDRLFKLGENASVTIENLQLIDSSTGKATTIQNLEFSSEDSLQELRDKTHKYGLTSSESFEKVEFITSSGCDVMIVLINSIKATERLYNSIYPALP